MYFIKSQNKNDRLYSLRILMHMKALKNIYFLNVDKSEVYS